MRREEAAEADWPAFGQPLERPSLSRSPEHGARVPARPASLRGHMAPLRALLSCLLPLHCALCDAAGSPTPGACGSEAQERVGPGVPAGQSGRTVRVDPGSFGAGGRRCAHWG